MKKNYVLFAATAFFCLFTDFRAFGDETNNPPESSQEIITENELPEETVTSEEPYDENANYTCLHEVEDFLYYIAFQEQSTLPDRIPVVLPDPVRKNIDIPGRDQPLTQKYIKQYLSDENRLWILRCLVNSIEYRPYIRQKLIENNMPLVLQYLPIIESNFTNSAVSRSGATGMWQFMENSMGNSLKKNAWYDDRRDPWKSTDAAIQKLKDNYKTFGNWVTAIAAYNCGAGAMKRYLRAHPGKDYWYLAENGLIKKETALYVPKLLAVAEIIENAEYYGAVEISMADKLILDAEISNFDYVTIAGMLSLDQISKITGIDKTTIQHLNPALYRGYTPAGTKYNLRLPEGTGNEAEIALKENAVPTDGLVHTVKKGDTLWGLSRKYGISVSDLCLINGIKENGILSLGQKIIIPIFN